MDDLQDVLHLADTRAPEPSAVVVDRRTLRSTPKGGKRADYDGAKRKKGTKLHMAVDTLGDWLALHVKATDIDDRTAVATLAGAVQADTDDTVEKTFVDQGYTGERAAATAESHGIKLEVVRRPGAKRGFVLLPRRWVIERSFA